MELQTESAGRILLVEDEPDTRILLAELLEYYGFEVESVETVGLAIERLERDCYPLVLADYITGRISDAEREANQLLDAAEPGAVACLSGWSPIPAALQQRFTFVMRKPCGAEDLLADIARVMKAQPRPSAIQKVLEYFDALTRKDWDCLAGLCSEFVQYRVTGRDPELSREVVGRESFRELSKQAFEPYPDARFEVLQLSSLPKGAVARYRSHWSSSANGAMSLDAVVAFAFVDEQIAQISVRIDLDHLREMQQHSVPPASS